MIRKISEDDLEFLNEVRNECRAWLHDSSMYTKEETVKWFNQNNPLYFIFELNGNKIGYFRTSNWEKGSCYIGLDIHKDFRGKKLAVPAFEELMRALNEDYNIQTFKLEVLARNVRAHSLYKKLGFKELSRQEYGEDQSILMEKNI